jgi:hypothetical protein
MEVSNKSTNGQMDRDMLRETFAFDVSNLSTYIQPSRELLFKTLNEGVTDKYVSIWAGIKNSEYINVASTTDVLSNQTCGTNFSSTTSVVESQLQVYPISVDDKVCASNFNPKALGLKLAPGSDDEDQAAFVNQFMEYKMKNIHKLLDKLAWCGSGTSAVNSMATAYGYLYQLTNTSLSASTVLYPTSGALTATTTSSNVIDQYEWITNNISADIINKDNLVIATTTSWFRLFANAYNRLTKTNLEIVTDNIGNMSMKAPGYPNITIFATIGLDGNQYNRRLICTYSDNMLKGIDGTKDNSFKLTYNPFDGGNWYFMFRSKVGFNVAIPEHVVML